MTRKALQITKVNGGYITELSRENEGEVQERASIFSTLDELVDYIKETFKDSDKDSDNIQIEDQQAKSLISETTTVIKPLKTFVLKEVNNGYLVEDVTQYPYSGGALGMSYNNQDKLNIFITHKEATEFINSQF